jgi:hypothetical protein
MEEVEIIVPDELMAYEGMTERELLISINLKMDTIMAFAEQFQGMQEALQGSPVLSRLFGGLIK